MLEWDLYYPPLINTEDIPDPGTGMVDLTVSSTIALRCRQQATFIALSWTWPRRWQSVLLVELDRPRVTSRAVSAAAGDG